METAARCAIGFMCWITHEGFGRLWKRAKPVRFITLARTRNGGNIEVTERILTFLEKPKSLIRHIEDRAGHDIDRYSLNCEKLQALGWRRTVDFEDGLKQTVAWYQEREDWWRPIKDGSFREYYERHYAARLLAAEETDGEAR